jgi:hypothetical protein
MHSSFFNTLRCSGLATAAAALCVCSLSQGFAAAANSAGRHCSTFLQRQPQDLLLSQVQQLQAEYKQLIMDAA